MHAEILEIAATILKLFGEHVVMHVIPVLSEQALGIGDQRVEMCLALLFSVIVRTVRMR